MTKLTEYPQTAEAAEYLGVAQNAIRKMGSPWRTPGASEPSEWIPAVQARGSQEVFGKSCKTAKVKKLNDSIE
jgi:hypothetical protein